MDKSEKETTSCAGFHGQGNLEHGSLVPARISFINLG